MGNWEHKSYLVALLVAVLLLVVMILFCRKGRPLGNWLDRQNPVAACLLLSFFCLLLNGFWVFAFHPVQAPDYATFFQAASDLANGRSLTGKDYVSMFPHILGYAAFLSIFLRLFSESLMTAALVNVLLTTLSGVILYVLSLKFYGRKAASLVFLFWAVCPSKLLYNAMSLSEPFYTCLLLLFFFLVSTAMDVRPGEKETSRAALGGLLSGAALAMVNAARPIGIIPIIAFLLWLFFLSDWRVICSRKKAVLLYTCLLLLSYVMTGSIWKSYAAARLEQAPPSIPGYSIYVGFNPDTQGSYADEDMDLLQSRYFGEYNRNAEAAQQSMLESAKERIADNRKTIPRLMVHKLGTLLGHDEGGAFYSRENFSDSAYSLWCVASNIWYYMVCLLAVAGCVRKGKKSDGNSILIVPLCFVGIVLAQLLVEVAARYHYCLIPMMLMMAAPIMQCGRMGRS
jgi:4-amino-4-deoxy-L-arabinose transferase-like glycosyltransferase